MHGNSVVTMAMQGRQGLQAGISYQTNWHGWGLDPGNTGVRFQAQEGTQSPKAYLFSPSWVRWRNKKNNISVVDPALGKKAA